MPALALDPAGVRRARDRSRRSSRSARGSGALSSWRSILRASCRCCSSTAGSCCAAPTRSPSTWPRRRSSPSAIRARSTCFPASPEDRAEIRRLVDWFHGKFNREVTQRAACREGLWPLRERPAAQSHATPDVELLRALRANLRYHLGYISYLARSAALAGRRRAELLPISPRPRICRWSTISARCHGRSIQLAKLWYARVKSRRAFRSLLADRLPGMPPPIALRRSRFLNSNDGGGR